MRLASPTPIRGPNSLPGDEASMKPRRRSASDPRVSLPATIDSRRRRTRRLSSTHAAGQSPDFRLLTTQRTSVARNSSAGLAASDRSASNRRSPSARTGMTTTRETPDQPVVVRGRSTGFRRLSSQPRNRSARSPPPVTPSVPVSPRTLRRPRSSVPPPRDRPPRPTESRRRGAPSAETRSPAAWRRHRSPNPVSA